MKAVRYMSRKNDDFNVEVIDLGKDNKRKTRGGKKTISGPTSKKNNKKRRKDIDVEKIDAFGRHHGGYDSNEE